MLTQTLNGDAIAAHIDDVVHTIDNTVVRHNKALKNLNSSIKNIDDFLSKCKSNLPASNTTKHANTSKQTGVAKTNPESKELMLERCAHIYVFLEYLAKNHAQTFNDSDRGNLRKAQAHLTRIKLWMMDNALQESERSQHSRSHK